MKKLFLLVVLFALTVSVNAQTKAAAKDTKSFKIGVGAMAGLPTGDIKPYADLAYTFDLTGEFTVTPTSAFIVSAGYFDLVRKSGYTGKGLIPLLAGAKYYFSDQIYGIAQAGISLSAASGGGSAFTYAPGIGYKISDKFDVSLKYQAAAPKGGGSISFLGLRAGLTF
jgi:hypothetical protein